ncbi:MAG TPA: hypothetical protein P5525_19920 [Candidatus Paceibacterota bacterium]|nr:hypothetical protein [Candidatus Paceibacterota bacterium]
MIQMMVIGQEQPIHTRPGWLCAAGQANHSMTMQAVHQASDGGAAGSQAFGGGHRTAAVTQVLREKTAHVIRRNALHGYASATEPRTEVLHRLGVLLDGVGCMAAVVQVAHEIVQDYGEMACRHPTPRESPLEVLLDHTDP